MCTKFLYFSTSIYVSNQIFVRTDFPCHDLLNALWLLIRVCLYCFHNHVLLPLRTLLNVIIIIALQYIVITHILGSCISVSGSLFNATFFKTKKWVWSCHETGLKPSRLDASFFVINKFLLMMKRFLRHAMSYISGLPFRLFLPETK